MHMNNSAAPVRLFSASSLGDYGGREISGSKSVRLAVAQNANAARTLFNDGMKAALTTFEMPVDFEGQNLPDTNLDAVFDRLPFGNFAIRQPITIISGSHQGRAVETLVVSREEDARILTLISEVRYVSTLIQRATQYMPSCDDFTEKEGRLILAGNVAYMVEFFAALYGRKHRFVDCPLTRQQLRSEGRQNTGYREYIVVSATDVRYPNAARSSAIMKRFRELHAVRGHARTYTKTGRTIWVKPHLRGKGDLVQVRDYVVQADTSR